MPAETLSELARQACSKNVKRLFDIGECPYDLVRSILLKIESPEQLHQIELASPQIIGRDSEIWLNLIKRDIPGWQTKPHEPRDPKNWWKVYRKLKQEVRNDMDQGAEKLKAAFANIQDEKDQNLAQLKTRRELPRQGMSVRQRTVHNYVSGKTGSKGAHAMSLIEKIKKEARGSHSMRTAIPTKDLKKLQSTVTRAPQDFLEETRRTQTSPVRPPVRAAAPPLALAQPRAAAGETSFQDREARLRALTSGQRLPRQDPAPVPQFDGPSSPPARNREVKQSSATESITPRAMQHPVATRPGSSAQFDEPCATVKSPPGAVEHKPLINRHGTASPQPTTTKRKAAPSVFMETKRPKVVPSRLDELF